MPMVLLVFITLLLTPYALYRLDDRSRKWAVLDEMFGLLFVFTWPLWLAFYEVYRLGRWVWRRFLSSEPYVRDPAIYGIGRDNMATQVACKACDWSTASMGDEGPMVAAYQEHWQRHHARGERVDDRPDQH
jgi:hypothetical protein